MPRFAYIFMSITWVEGNNVKGQEIPSPSSSQDGCALVIDARFVLACYSNGSKDSRKRETTRR